MSDRWAWGEEGESHRWNVAECGSQECKQGGLAINHWDARSGMCDQYRKEGRGRVGDGEA